VDHGQLDPVADAMVRALKRLRRRGPGGVGTRQADVYLERKATSVVNWEGEGWRRWRHVQQGACVRLFDGRDAQWTYAGGAPETALDEALEGQAAGQAARTGRSGQAGRIRRSSRHSETPEAQQWPAVPDGDPRLVPAADKLDLIQRVVAAARRVDDRVWRVNVNYADTVQEIWVAGTDGEVHYDRRPLLRLFVRVFVRGRDGGVVHIEDGHCGTMEWDQYRTSAPLELAREVAAAAVAMLEAGPGPSGELPVVLAPGAGALWLHEACGHLLEADYARRRGSPLGGLRGDQVAAPLVTICDDPLLPGGRGSYRVDDEGVPARRTVLVEQGVLRSFLHDRRTALACGTTTTGNGRRDGFRHAPLPRMSNTVLMPGGRGLDVDDLVRATGYGLFVRRIGDGTAEVGTGNFRVRVTEGYVIEGGRSTRPVHGALLMGNALETIRSVDLVGDDFRMSGAGGTCHKDGQLRPVGVGQPAVRIGRLRVCSGSGGPGRRNAVRRGGGRR